MCVHIYSLRPVALPADRQHILAPRDRLTDTQTRRDTLSPAIACHLRSAVSESLGPARGKRTCARLTTEHEQTTWEEIVFVKEGAFESRRSSTRGHRFLPLASNQVLICLAEVSPAEKTAQVSHQRKGRRQRHQAEPCEIPDSAKRRNACDSRSFSQLSSPCANSYAAPSPP